MTTAQNIQGVKPRKIKARTTPRSRIEKEIALMRKRDKDRQEVLDGIFREYLQDDIEVPTFYKRIKTPFPYYQAITVAILLTAIVAYSLIN